ncbi:hypothetical protein ACFSC4_09755 [Deinococcus malanensis]|uniref:hypothetical protein n=1 Tax=Deinococcus malanensis TaxID=1706855 RepID=UPI00363A8BA7
MGFGFHCAQCSDAFEFDDVGVPDEPYRHVLLEQDGTWLLEPSSGAKSFSVHTWIRLRHALALDLTTLARLKALPHRVRIKGTAVEMNWLAQQCSEPVSIRQGGESELHDAFDFATLFSSR